MPEGRHWLLVRSMESKDLSPLYPIGVILAGAAHNDWVWVWVWVRSDFGHAVSFGDDLRIKEGTMTSENIKGPNLYLVGMNGVIALRISFYQFKGFKYSA